MQWLQALRRGAHSHNMPQNTSGDILRNTWSQTASGSTAHYIMTGNSGKSPAAQNPGGHSSWVHDMIIKVYAGRQQASPVGNCDNSASREALIKTVWVLELL